MKYTDEEYQQQMNCLLSQLNKKQKRLYVAFEANCIGLGGGQILSQIMVFLLWQSVVVVVV